MSGLRQSKASQKRLSPAQWKSAVELYELGYKNQRQLAERFGVSITAIHKGLKKRNAVKGCRVEETLVPLRRALARNQVSRLVAQRAALARGEQLGAMIGALIEQLVDADRRGNLVEMQPIIEQVRRAL